MTSQIDAMPEIVGALERKPVQSLGHPMTAMDLLAIALQNNAAIDIIERLKALQEREHQQIAEASFNDAMNRAQAELGRVAPDLFNKQTQSRYASYAALDRKIRPVYVKEGFSLSFDTDESSPETVKVLCYVSHKDGFTRTYRAVMPADGKGAKGGDVMTKTHATGAAMSYGMRYLLKMIFNIAIGEEDNDGNTNAFSDLQERLEWIENCRTQDELGKVYKAAFKDASAAKDYKALGEITTAYEARKKAIHEGR